MRIGFTGTQQGMTENQKEELIRLLLSNDNSGEFHHGDCIGADEQAAHEAHRIGYKICSHPPINPTKRAFFYYEYIRYEPKDYLVRNCEIVDSCDLLIATPKEKEEQLRSGTWATIRYARKTGKPVEIIYP